MRGEVVLNASLVLGFLLTLVRVSGVFVFVPLPGVSGTLHPARVILAMGITLSLFSQWPQVKAAPSVGELVQWIAVEAALGIGIGLAIGFVAESFGVGAQLLGLQAGYSFASTIDPTSQADSTVLVVFSQLVAGLLFFATGLDREVIRVFAHSLEVYPAGSFVLTKGAATGIVNAGSVVFSAGLRLALPLIAVLATVDISLALLGRVNAQLQLLPLAFPVKMLIGLALLGWLAVMFPPVFESSARTTFTAVHGLMVH